MDHFRDLHKNYHLYHEQNLLSIGVSGMKCGPKGLCVCVAVWDNIVHPLFVTSVLNACEERELDGMSEGAEAA